MLVGKISSKGSLSVSANTSIKKPDFHRQNIVDDFLLTVISGYSRLLCLLVLLLMSFTKNYFDKIRCWSLGCINQTESSFRDQTGQAKNDETRFNCFLSNRWKVFHHFCFSGKELVVNLLFSQHLEFLFAKFENLWLTISNQTQQFITHPYLCVITDYC